MRAKGIGYADAPVLVTPDDDTLSHPGLLDELGLQDLLAACDEVPALGKWGRQGGVAEPWSACHRSRTLSPRFWGSQLWGSQLSCHPKPHVEDNHCLPPIKCHILVQISYLSRVSDLLELLRFSDSYRARHRSSSTTRTPRTHPRPSPCPAWPTDRPPWASSETSTVRSTTTPSRTR